MTIRGLETRINKHLWLFKRKINYYIHSDFVGDKAGISIISCNCIGGVLMHEMNMRFLTPTINLYFSADDFIKFCEELDTKKYFSLELEDAGISPNGSYPLVRLGDLTIEAVHYKSFDDFKQSWEKRKSRINYDKIFLIFTDRDGFHGDKQTLERIKKLPYNKVLFSKCDYLGYDFVCKVPEFENESQVGDMTDWCKGITWKRKYSIYPFVKKFHEYYK